MFRLLFHAYARLIDRHGLLVLALFVAALSFIGGGARRAVQNNTNDVKRWLPANYPETQTLQWYQRQFGHGSDQLVLLSWEGCRLGDERLKLMTLALRQATDDEYCERAYGEPARFRTVQSGPEILDRLSDPDGLNFSRDEALSRMEGALIGPDYLHGVLLDPQKAAPTVAKLEYGTPAAASGLAPGDVVMAVNGSRVPTLLEARDLLLSLYEEAPEGTIHVATLRFPQGVSWHWRGPRPERQSGLLLTLTEFGSQEKQLETTMERIREIASARCAVPPEDVRMGGPPVDNVAINVEGRRTLVRLAFLSFGLGLFMCWVCLRDVKHSLMVFLTALFAEGTSLAIVWYSGAKVDAIMMSMPSLIYVTTISGSIHLVNYYRDCVRTGGAAGAASRAVGRCGLASLLCNVTSAMGLISLETSDLVPIQNFGLYSAISIMAALVWIFFFLPAVLTLWPMQPKTAEHHAEPGLLAALAAASGRWFRPAGAAVLRRHKWLLAFNLAVMIFFGLQLSQMKTTVKLIKLFDEDTEIIHHYQWLESRLGNLVPMEVVVHVPTHETIEIGDPAQDGAYSLQFTQEGELITTEPIPNGAHARDVQAALRNAGLSGAIVRTLETGGGVQHKVTMAGEGDVPLISLAESEGAEAPAPSDGVLMAEPNVRVLNALTMAQALKLVDQARQKIEGLSSVGVTLSAVTFAPDLYPNGRRFQRQAEMILNQELLKFRGDYLASGFLAHSDGEDLYRISLRVGAFDDVDYSRFVADIKAAVDPVVAQRAASGASGLRTTYTGIVPLVYKAQNELMRGLVSSYFSSFLMIGAMMAVITCLMAGFFRGLVAGFLVMMPNIMPTLVVFGALAYTGTLVDVGMVMTASVALGIAVDDEIHFLAWFNHGIKAGMARREACWFAYQNCAAAMTHSTVVAAVGMGIFAFSTFTPTMKFGLMMVPLVMIALEGDLVMMPSILASPLGWFFVRRQPRISSAQRHDEAHAALAGPHGKMESAPERIVRVDRTSAA
ncbi:MAG: MMPL family transporter [Planctomycetia bacterium]|nr:MMPL family transporter [Planctomycetia bacterium]